MDPGQQSSPLPQPSAEYFSWEHRLHLIGLGFAFYAAVFLLSHLLSVALSRTYRSLLNKEKVFWNLAATRAAFGTQSTVAGLRALTEDSVINRDRVRGQEDWSWFNVLTATGFFVFENVAFHASNVVFRSFDVPLATHHFFALSGYAGAVVWDTQGHFLPMVTLLLEMSTPFTCISWMLLKVWPLYYLFVSCHHFALHQSRIQVSLSHSSTTFRHHITRGFFRLQFLFDIRPNACELMKSVLRRRKFYDKTSIWYFCCSSQPHIWTSLVQYGLEREL